MTAPAPTIEHLPQATGPAAHRGRWLAMLATVAALTLAGCAGSDVPPNPSMPPHGAPAVAFELPMSVVHDALIETFGEMGCSIRRDSPVWVQAGFPPGEVVEVSLREPTPGHTNVWISTQTTFRGGAWQKDRNAEVQWALRRTLRSKLPGTVAT